MLRLLKKDLLLFFRSGTSTLFIMLTPFLVIGVLGAVLGSGFGTFKGIPIMICDFDDGELSDEFIQAIMDSNSFQSEISNETGQEDCRKTAMERIRSGELDAAMVFPQGMTSRMLSGEGQVIEVITDSSQTEVSNFVSLFSQGFTQYLSSEMRSRFVQSSWDRLKELEKELERMNSTAKEANARIGIMLEQTKATRKDLDAVDVEGLTGEVEAIREQSRKIDTMPLGRIRNDLIDLGTAAESSTYPLSRAKFFLERIENEKQNSISDMRSLDYELSSAEALLGCPEGNETLCPLIDNARDGIASSISDLQSMPTTEALSELGSVELGDPERIEDNEELAKELEESIHAANQRMEQNNASVERLLTEMESLSQTKQEGADALDDVEEGLLVMENGTLELISASEIADNEIERIIEKQPTALVNPITVEENRLFVDVSFFEAVFPAATAMILMFSAIMLPGLSLIREKQCGTLLRVAISKTPLSIFLLSKMISNLVLCLIQFTVVVAIGKFLLGIKFGGSPLLLLASVLSFSFAFSGLGLLIGSLSKSDNTVILAAIAITLPSLFLSGAMFPLELMPLQVRNLSTLLPLSSGVEAIESIMIYGAGAELVKWPVINNLSYGLALSALSLAAMRLFGKDK